MSFLTFCRRLFRRRSSLSAPGLREIFQGFKQVLAANGEVLALMGDLEESLSGRAGFHLGGLKALLSSLDRQMDLLVEALERMSGGRWPEIPQVWQRLKEGVRERLSRSLECPDTPLVLALTGEEPARWAAMGGKAANLARLGGELHLPVPPGFATTFSAYRLFLTAEAAGGRSLADQLTEKLAALPDAATDALDEAARELQALVLSQPLPEELSQALRTAARALAAEPRDTLVVRSSGRREDLAASFAGQYDSFLGVRPEEVPEYWRRVVASQFSHRALAYLKKQGFSLDEMAMGVIIQRLIPAAAAGLMFTRDPEGDHDTLLISATWGLGAELADGRVQGDLYRVERGTGALREAKVAPKMERLVPGEGGLLRLPVPPGEAEQPALTAGECRELAELAAILEDYFGLPQDVEWVRDEEGRLWVVQSRPLHVSPAAAGPPKLTPGETAPLLLAGGDPAAAGVGAGPVFHLREMRHLAEIPEGVVLVAPRTTPHLAPFLPRVAALVTEVGSPTGHLALVAREYGIPALVNVPGALELLPAGETVTVDASHSRVYRGRVKSLLQGHGRRPRLRRFPLYDQLREVADLIIPLNQVDPRSPSFRPDNCRTYHDLAYFIHEKAMQLMFGLMDRVAEGRVPALRLLKLDTPLPLNLHLVDLGDGLASHENPVPPEDIISLPMRALWRGISHPGISWAGPVPVDMGGFLHVLGQAAIRPPENFWDKTYAIVARNYVNYACRLGYHFQSVDSYMTDHPGDNYINFNFKGGAADEIRRIRRTVLIDTVLTRLGFEVERHKDVIRARFRKRPLPEMEERLDLLGRLMAYVRQMDMLMKDDDTAHLLAARFLAGHYERPGEETGGERGQGS
jgi:pyruvate,water dikinase